MARAIPQNIYQEVQKSYTCPQRRNVTIHPWTLPQHSWSTKNICAGGSRKQTLKNARSTGEGRLWIQYSKFHEPCNMNVTTCSRPQGLVPQNYRIECKEINGWDGVVDDVDHSHALSLCIECTWNTYYILQKLLDSRKKETKRSSFHTFNNMPLQILVYASKIQCRNEKIRIIFALFYAN